MSLSQLLTIILFLLSFSSFSLFSQVAIIQDPDAWTNVRLEASGKSKVIHKLYENEVFFYSLDEYKKQNI